MNVISIDLLIKDGYNFFIKKDYCDIIMNDVTIMHGQLKHGICTISQHVSIMYTSNKCPRIDIMDIYL